MKINKITLKSARNANIFLVGTDRGEFTLHSDIIVKHGLTTGEVADDLFLLSVTESMELIALNTAIKYMTNAIKSEKQLKDYLYKKEFTTPTINAVINKLKEYNIINDTNFANSYIKSNPNFSKNKLKQKLLSFGIKAENFDESLSEVDEVSSCTREVEKFFRSRPVDKANTEKLMRRLMSQGYSYDTIRRVLHYSEED